MTALSSMPLVVINCSSFGLTRFVGRTKNVDATLDLTGEYNKEIVHYELEQFRLHGITDSPPKA